MKRRSLYLFLFFSLFAGIVFLAPRPAPAGTFDELDYERWIVRAEFDNPVMVAPLAMWTEPWEVNYDEGYVILEVSQEEHELLLKQGFEVTIESALTAELYRPRQPLPGQGDDTIPGYPCYGTVEGTFARAQNMATTYPDLAEWVDVGDSWEKETPGGQPGYDMMVLVLTNENIPGPKPVFFATSAIHAREYTTAELATRFAEQILADYDTDPDATWVLDHHEIHLMLHANPDGRKHAEAGNFWRKNTNQNYCSPTSSNRGADLNRNFEFQWGCCGGSSGSQCSTTYRGPSPASEPEVQAIQNYALSIFPDQRNDPINDPAPTDATGTYIDIHSYSELVLWPWGFTNSPTGNGTALQTLGRKLAFYNGYEPMQAIGLYPTDGTTDDFFYGELGVASYTYELGTSFFQGCSTFENTILPDNLPSLMYAAKTARTPYMTPAGPDSLNVAVSSSNVPAGTLVDLTATINDTRYENQNGNEPTQDIAGAEYYVDTPYWDGGVATAMSPSDGNFNNQIEGATATIDTTGWSEGRHIIFVRGQDDNGNWGATSAVFLTIESKGGAIVLAGTTPLNGTTPAPGSTIEWDSSVTNTGGSSTTADVTIKLVRPDKPDVILAGPKTVNLNAGETKARTMSFTVPSSAGGGLTFSIVTEVTSGGVTDSASVEYTITP